ncbi:MAG: peptide deformylase [Deltaproteobacteria bacterium]|nr:peptide deformylase [Deltaproteobacteria bacterium]MBW2396778.1 peptide deformylase [Deltaproteobacteria bacterium]
MALRPVLLFPDPRLKRVSSPVDEVTDALRSLAADMIEVMYDEPGIGLAAPQVGEAVRMVVMDTEWTEEGNDRDARVIINPEILEREGSVIWTEGCLSVPDFQAEVERAAQVTVRYTDLEGEEHVEECDELRAVCFQHEIDHLDGVLFVDRISRLKRTLYTKKRKKALKLEEEEDVAEGRAF